MKSLLISVSILFCLSAASQQAAERLFSTEQLLADYDSAHAWIKAIHPKLYANADSMKTEKAWKAVRKQINKPMSELAFIKLLSPLVHQYNDGHTFLDKEFNHPAFDTFRKTGGLLFPLEVKIFGGMLLVKSDSFSHVPTGSRITAINNVPTKELLKQVKNLMSADGPQNMDANCSRLFAYLLWWAYQWNGEFKINYESPTGKNYYQLVKGISVDEYYKRIFPSPLWTMKLYPAESLAVIECTSYSGNMDRIREKLDSFFTIVKQQNIQHVALDLRRNGGGNSYIGDILLSYVTTKPYAAVQSKTFRQSWAIENIPETDFRKKEIDQFKAEAANENGFLTVSYQSSSPLQLKKQELFFTGKFYLLTSYRTYSSAHMTAMQVKCGGLGTIIGQPTGEQVDLTGEIKGFPLPNTKLPLWIPMAMYKAACAMPEKIGVQPDYYVEPNIESVIKGNDTEIFFLQDLIRKSR